MLSQSGERTLVATIIPPGVAHLNTAVATCFVKIEAMLDYTAVNLALPIDFFTKSTGMGHTNVSLARKFILPAFDSVCQNALRARLLMLSCVTGAYSVLWQQAWNGLYATDCWTKQDSRLKIDRFASLKPSLSRASVFRFHYERRQALIEIDVLVSMALGLTLEELKTIYRIQFPVLKQNEQDTWYDQRGRIVFTASKGLPGVGFSRPQWEQIKNMTGGTVERQIIDDTIQGGPRERTIVHEAPFDKCDREKDYETAWAEFERRGLNERK
jgi:hypothetical protein